MLIFVILNAQSRVLGTICLVSTHRLEALAAICHEAVLVIK
jgi:hypothetical protein